MIRSVNSICVDTAQKWFINFFFPLEHCFRVFFMELGRNIPTEDLLHNFLLWESLICLYRRVGVQIQGKQFMFHLFSCLFVHPRILFFPEFS